jgi:hypothetical protein
VDLHRVGSIVIVGMVQRRRGVVSFALIRRSPGCLLCIRHPEFGSTSGLLQVVPEPTQDTVEREEWYSRLPDKYALLEVRILANYANFQKKRWVQFAYLRCVSRRDAYLWCVPNWDAYFTCVPKQDEFKKESPKSNMVLSIYNWRIKIVKRHLTS